MKSLHGVGLQENYCLHQKDFGVEMSKTLDSIPENSLDSSFAFHVLEHLPDPKKVINKLYLVTMLKGVVVVEAPNARDLLCCQLSLERFKHFALWSQHLVLHTRDSLKRLLMHTNQEAI